MNIVVWISQGVLAALMLFAGALKLAKTKEELLASGNMGWTEDFAESQIKGIGTLEVLAAIGLILPAVLDVAPVLVAVTAVGVMLLMLGAAATHARRGEKQVLPVNLLIAAVAAFVAVERFGANSF